MSVLEIIEEIERMPPNEQEIVASFVENLKTLAAAPPDRLASGDKFEEAAHHVFENYGSLLERLAK